MGDVSQSNPELSQWHYLDYLQMGVMIIDEFYQIVFWNRWLENHSNLVSESVEQQPFKKVFPELAESRLFELVQQVLEEKLSGIVSSSLNQSLLPLYPSINHQLKQMDMMKQMLQVSAIVDADGRQLAMVQVTDMTRAHIKGMQLKEQSKTVQSLISVDHVTDLANRQKFDACLHDEYRRALRAETSLSIAVVEIDHFDSFVANYGQQRADQCLEKVSALFDALLCRETDLVARYNSRAFGLVMPCTSVPGANLIAQEVLRAVKSLDITHELSATSSVMTVSVGMAQINPSQKDDEAQFLKAVNFSLNHAQKSGGDKAMIYLMDGGKLYDCAGAQQNAQLMLEM